MGAIQGFGEIILAAFVMGGIVGAALALHLRTKGEEPTAR